MAWMRQLQSDRLFIAMHGLFLKVCVEDSLDDPVLCREIWNIWGL